MLLTNYPTFCQQRGHSACLFYFCARCLSRSTREMGCRCWSAPSLHLLTKGGVICQHSMSCYPVKRKGGSYRYGGTRPLFKLILSCTENRSDCFSVLCAYIVRIVNGPYLLFGSKGGLADFFSDSFMVSVASPIGEGTLAPGGLQGSSSLFRVCGLDDSAAY